MIALVEGAERQKTPNEIALNILLAGLTIIFVFAVATIPSLCGLCRWQHHGAGAGGAVRHPDPHHHRRAAVGHRHRRHGPAGALQCAGHVGPRGGSGGRCGYAAAGQDRHHHPGQSPGHRIPAAGRRERTGTGGSRLSGFAAPTRRRKAAPSWRWPRANMASKDGQARGHFRALHRPDPAVGHRFPRRLHPQGRGGRGAGLGRPVTTGRRGADHDLRPHRQDRRHAAGGGQGQAAAGRHPSQGHRQGRHPRAFRGAAPDGHPHRDDHRRQSAHRRGHRRGSRGGRFPRPGDAGEQAQL